LAEKGSKPGGQGKVRETFGKWWWVNCRSLLRGAPQQRPRKRRSERTLEDPQKKKKSGRKSKGLAQRKRHKEKVQPGLRPGEKERAGEETKPDRDRGGLANKSTPTRKKKHGSLSGKKKNDRMLQGTGKKKTCHGGGSRREETGMEEGGVHRGEKIFSKFTGCGKKLGDQEAGGGKSKPQKKRAARKRERGNQQQSKIVDFLFR